MSTNRRVLNRTLLAVLGVIIAIGSAYSFTHSLNHSYTPLSVQTANAVATSTPSPSVPDTSVAPLPTSANTPPTTPAAPSVKTPDQIAQDITHAGLPIAQVTVKAVANPRGTVVYIPQNHRNPGAQLSDPINNSAVITQSQIMNITRYLTQNEGTNYVMAEGDLYGPVASNTLDVIGQKISAAAALKSALTDLQQVCQDTACQRVYAGAQALEQKLAREALLAGGAHDLKAEGASFALIGAEDKATQDKASGLVRQYFYLNDRITTLAASNPSDTQSQSPASTIAAQGQSGATLAQLMQMIQTATPLVTDVAPQDLSALQAQDPQLSSQINTLSNAVTLAHNAESADAALIAQQSAGLPNRSDNPYANVTDQTVLKADLSSLETQMQSTIVDERNQVAATNFVRGLTDQNTTTGALIFGAGHTPGLVQALENEHLNVVIVVPQNLAQDQEIMSAING